MSFKVLVAKTAPHKQEHTRHTDWSLCILCQKKSNVPLVNSSNVKRFKISSYDRHEERLHKLNDLDSLPLGIHNLERLDDGVGIAETFRLHKARWHKTCFDMCNEAKISRALKKTLTEHESSDEGSPVKKILRRSFADENGANNGCFFCNKEEGEMHKVETLTLDQKIRKIATELKDTQILAKLAAGDMTATDAVYHKNCLSSFYNKYRSYVRKNTPNSASDIETQTNKATAFAELVTYIESFESTESKENHIFKLSDLNRMYTNRLQQLGTKSLSNSSHLKEKLLAAVPSLEEHSTEYETMVSFRKHIGNSLLAATQNDFENDTLVLMRAANIIRKDIFKTKNHFHGSLEDEQYESIPETLRLLADMILNGRDISNETEKEGSSSEILNSLTQLIVFNTLKRKRKDTTYHRHVSERETKLPLYLCLLIHGKTRKRELVDILHDRGLCISYDRVMQISTDIANSVITQFEESHVVCPSFFKNNVFTTGNLDNIDHNPSSNTSRDAFHGTAISLTQHLTDTGGNSRAVLNLKSTPDMKTTKALPTSYTDVLPVVLKNKLKAARQLEQKEPNNGECDLTCQTDWLKHVQNMLDKDSLGKDEYVSWSGYFASRESQNSRPPAVSALLPLFREEAHSVAMIKHGMTIVRNAIDFKNHGQTPVLTVDQPLYVIAKKIQWTWPSAFGEDKYVVLMGGLHIEMSLLKCLGDWLEGSGWLSALTSGNVISPGRAEVVQRGGNTSRGQWIHQVMAASLYILQQKAYQVYTSAMVDTPEQLMSFPDWCRHMSGDGAHPQFQYWNTTMHLELLFMQFLRSQRESNFELYKQTLRQLLPWLFTLDHVHYARWLSVHLQDLDNLQTDCPNVYREFVDGKFVTKRSGRRFSCIAHDQVHEQLNTLIKGDGGFVGITENQETLKRWTVSAPELMRILQEVEVETPLSNTNHHEQGRSTQSRFGEHTRSLVTVIEDLGNPFTEESSDLVTLDTKIVLTEEAVKSVKTAEQTGKDQYVQFVANSINGTGSIYDPIRKNNLHLFRAGSKGMPSKIKNRVRSMKTDVQLFSRMYIACQSRDGDLDTFFEHENHLWPPSRAEQNRPRSGNKSELVTCLEATVEQQTECPDVELRIFDGAALVQVLDPKKARVKVHIFGEYAKHVFLPFITKHLHEVSQVEVVWDIYKDASLKAFTSQMRGSGEYVRVTENTNVPVNWKTFLRNDNNKTQLFQFLADCIETMETETDKLVLTTKGDHVLSSKRPTHEEIDLSTLQPCNHEEADTRMLLHAASAYQQGKKSVMIYATDTDVVVLAIALASAFPECFLWLGYGQANYFRYIPAHDIAKQIGPDASRGVLFVHAFSGCDTVSYFNSVGKKTAFKLWMSQPEIILVCKRLSKPEANLTEADIMVLERFTVLLYAKTSAFESVNDARKHLFSQKGRQIANIPPSKSALMQHIYRAVYQASYVWGQMHISMQRLPSPSDWGWKMEGSVWVPHWSALPEASKACRELIRCGCKSACAGRCKCFKANLPCTFLCYCEAGCDRV